MFFVDFGVETGKKILYRLWCQDQGDKTSHFSQWSRLALKKKKEKRREVSTNHEGLQNLMVFNLFYVFEDFKRTREKDKQLANKVYMPVKLKFV